MPETIPPSSDPPPTNPLTAPTWALDGDLDVLEAAEPVAPPPTPEPPPPPRPSRAPAVASLPSADKIAEAMLFAGGPPLTAEKFAVALRVPVDVLHQSVAELNKKYRSQNRPYSVQPRDGGYVLAVKPAYRGMREKLFGGPREARLSQPALDVLSVVAYRQPIDKAEIDTIRGLDSGSTLRQLVRLGLMAVAQRGDADHPDVKYGTTNRFLEVFNLTSLDDLPRLGDAQQL
ncbi:SMC-Scp complex subunit ScpB [Limnoglobus roseus]|uniref:SMC-Scp complex subunit ScpB n=1 Tax=Limnoglobus roseus TaxID=2598579 RepID=A0A5C1A6X4_9BACT|nr:SMC-Scp complex subunit ScpB [Limnoglobus roseus]QEL13746.1 SMC-Scp complex subunit ScpB [Limnoglobus roseus]